MMQMCLFHLYCFIFRSLHSAAALCYLSHYRTYILLILVSVGDMDEHVNNLFKVVHLVDIATAVKVMTLLQLVVQDK